MEFWKMAFDFGWVTVEELRGAVKTETRTNGEITPEQFKEITKEDFIRVTPVPTETVNTTENKAV